ncbi:MAG: hypothetical protein K6E56_01830 [Lachnospiraceae bacterium]|nr:hypothetical protein [Lachnospiraceae bacterium]
MKKRYLTLAMIILVGIIICVMQGVLYTSEKSEKAGAFVNGYTTDDASYVIDMKSSGSFAYKISGKGKADNVISAKKLGFDTFDSIVSGGEGPLVSASYIKGETSYCKIFLLGENLTPLQCSPLFALPEGVLISDVTEESGEYYVSGLAADRSAAYIYTMPSSLLVDYSKDAEKVEAISLNCIFENKSTDGTYFLGALYRGGNLHILTDREAPSDIFKEDPKAREAYDNAKIGIIDRMMEFEIITLHFVVFIILVIVIFVLLMTLGSKHPFVSISLACISGVTVLLIFTGAAEYARAVYNTDISTLSFVSGYLGAVSDEVIDTDFASANTSELYQGETYDRMKKALDGSLHEAVLIDAKTNKVVFARSGLNRFDVRELYGEEFETMCKLAKSNYWSYGTVIVHGKRYAAYVGSLEPEYEIPYLLAGLYEVQKPGVKEMLQFWLFLLAILVLFSAGFIVKIVFEYRALKNLAESMAKVANNTGEEIVIPTNKPYRIARLWEALGEIAGLVKRMNYTAYEVYEAYFRFAPKKVETILDKPSIAEVEVGNLTEFNGTEAVLTVADKDMSLLDDISDMNKLLSIVEKHQEKNGGVMVSSDLSVGLLKIIFKEKVKTLSFGIDFCHETESVWPESERCGMVLHYGRFRYGVAGTSHQSMAFLHSEESVLLEKYSQWLRDKGLFLCVTESTKDHEGLTEGLRYVGLIHEDNIKLDIYEVLDSNPVRIRSGKISTLDKYNKALESFRSLDFYLARNLFSEILREVPEDDLVKWYLFESERMLNNGPGGELLRLHMD